MAETNLDMVPNEIIESKIFIIRGKKVMLDSDLAELYGVETKILKRAVNRNVERFPVDFMFELTLEEAQNSRCQIGTLKRGSNIKYLPYAFTEQGVAMLSSVLKSSQAIQVNIQIMRTFTKLRELLLNNKELKVKIDQLENKYDGQFRNIFDAIRLLIDKTAKIERRISTEETKPEKKYGFLADRE